MAYKETAPECIDFPGNFYELFLKTLLRVYVDILVDQYKRH